MKFTLFNVTVHYQAVLYWKLEGKFFNRNKIFIQQM